MTLLAAAVLFPAETLEVLRAMASRPRSRRCWEPPCPTPNACDFIGACQRARAGERTIGVGVSYLPPRAAVTR